MGRMADGLGRETAVELGLGCGRGYDSRGAITIFVRQRPTPLGAESTALSNPLDKRPARSTKIGTIMTTQKELRAGMDRRRQSRGGRRPADVDGFSPLVMVVGDEAAVGDAAGA